MSDFDLATLPDLLARLEGQEPMQSGPMGTVYELPRWRDEWKRERADCAAVIRALMAERGAADDEAKRFTAHMLREFKAAVAAEREACALACIRVGNAVIDLRNEERSRITFDGTPETLARSGWRYVGPCVPPNEKADG